MTKKQTAQQKWAWRRFHLAAMKQKLRIMCEDLDMNHQIQGIALMLNGLNTANDFDAVAKGVKVKV